METALQTLIEMVRDMSPVIWEASVKGAVVGGFSSLFASIILFALIVPINKGRRLVNAKYEDDEKEHWTESSEMLFLNVFWGIVILLFFVLGMMELHEAAMGIFAPEWTAIQNLVGLVQPQ